VQYAQHIAPDANTSYYKTLPHQFINFVMQLDEPDAKLVAVSLRRIDMHAAQCALLIAPYKSYNSTRYRSSR
jgi:hypothetical protein